MANKFFQPPDINPTGLDTLFSQYVQGFRKLADDWVCNETGEIDKVTLWVSFLNDAVPQGGLAGVHLSVHADIPASPPTNPYSKPGALLAQWDLGPSEFTLAPHIGPVSEYFWDPMLGQQPLGTDTQIWQLDCFIPQGQRFPQQQGTIYWLDAFVTTGDQGTTLCGWKTSPNGMAPDAAVWTDDPAPEPPPSSWTAMQYPGWHQSPGMPLNLSFAIETVPAATTTRPATTTGPATTTRPATTTTGPATTTRPATTPPATTQPPGTTVPHPADTGPGAPNWRFGLTEVLAYAAGWLNGSVLSFLGTPLAGPGVAQAYILRMAAIALAHYQGRYEDVGSAEPINSPAHAFRWRSLPDA